MRKIFTLGLFTVLCAFAQAQTITGLLKDDASKAVAGASITLHKSKDSSIAKIAVSDKDGKYIFNITAIGKYFVSVASVGFKKTNSAVFEYSGSKVEVPILTLTKASKDLGEVTVTSKKPMIEVKADKTVFNIENSINAVGTDAFELLRKSPGVMIDKDDNLQLSGKNGVQVYIDGRPSPLSGKDLADYLRSMQSSNIEAIELITNPSAKYDAAGNAGIINIRLKKNKSFGTNGSVNAGYAIGTYSKYNAGLNLNNRNKKINLFGNYNYNHSKNINTLSIYRELLDSAFDQNGDMIPISTSHTFKVGADYYANKKNTFGFIVDGNFSNTDMTNNVTTPLTYKPTNTFIRTLVANNTSAMKNNNININGNYKYIDTSGHELNFDANYGRFDNNNNQLQPNYYKDASYTTYSTIIYRMISPSIIDILNGKVDYEQKFAGGKLGAGIKISNVKTINDFQRYDVQNIATDTKTLDTSRSNKFTYKEQINAGYINFNKQFKGVMFQIGLRVENSNVTGNTLAKSNDGSGWKEYDTTFERKYTDLFPNASLSFNKNPMNQWSVSYSRRIDRPAYQQLNPFEFKLDEYTYQKGNTNLTPQYTNIFSISNTYKYMLTTSLSYSHIRDMFAQIIDTTEKSKSFMTNKNLATQDIFNLSISYPFQKGIYSAYFSVNAFYSKYKADNVGGAGRNISLEVTSANLYMQHTFNLGKGYRAELSSWFSTPSIQQGTFESKAMGFVDLGLSKQIMQGKGNIKLAVSDIFKTMRWRGTSNFVGQYLNGQFRWESQQIKLNFSYRFGKNTVKAARQRATGVEDESKRVQSGGGFGG
ncbi:MAG: TonB-dependent receptor domain-containing protein [Chitinophagaceae bacterium]